MPRGRRGVRRCASPKVYGGLATGSYTVNVRAVDAAGNTSAATSTTWTVDATPPTAAMTFPTATTYNLAGWTAGCGTPADGDLCGTATDAGSGLSDVAVSIRRVSTNSYWDGAPSAPSTETWRTATGTTSWSYRLRRHQLPRRRQLRGPLPRHRRGRQRGHPAGDPYRGHDAAPHAADRPGTDDPSSGSVQFDFSDTEAGTTFSAG